MQTKHRKMLAAIFTDPVPAGIKWRDIEVLCARWAVNSLKAAAHA